MQKYFTINRLKKVDLLITLILLLILVNLPSPNCFGQLPSKPNIVLIFIDDWAWNATPVRMNDELANSAMPLLRMPNLQTMANNGMKFTNAYSGAPQCSPSRVALQTGQSSPRNGFTVYMNSRWDSSGYDLNPDYSQFPVVPCISDMYIDEDAVTIPEVLNPLGYVCAHFGKWHMRGDPADEGYAAHDGNTTNNEGNEKIPGDPKRMYSLTDTSVKFMQNQVEAGKPFYLQISHWAMHEGRECLDETRRKYQEMPEIQAYYQEVGKTASTINYRQDPAVRLGMADNLDDCIGTVKRAIEALGIGSNTYVILTIDNGYREPYYPLLQPLHGGKWWLWQGGLRVPMIVTGPGIPAGSVSETCVVNYDFLPTFVEWAGGDPDALSDIDGKSLAGILRGEKPAWDLENRNLYFHYPHYRTTMPHSTLISAGKWKVMHFYEAPDVPMLFDLGEDRGEFKNIARSRPIKHDILYMEMMNHLYKVGARIPKENPDYDPAVYQAAKEYEKRVMWGAFEGERPVEDDEK